MTSKTKFPIPKGLCPQHRGYALGKDGERLDYCIKCGEKRENW